MPQSTALPAPTRRQGASVNLTEPRAARTHEALTTALFELLREHDLTEISISELCRTAGVHRTTFYGHYADIYAFASDAFARILDDLAALAGDGDGDRDGDGDPHARDELREKADDPEVVTAAYYETMRDILQYILDHRSAYRMMFGTRVDAGFRRDFHQRLLTHGEVAVYNWQRFGIAEGVDPATAAAFIAGGSVGVFEQWANSDSTDVDGRAADLVGVTRAWAQSLAMAKPTTGRR